MYDVPLYASCMLVIARRNQWRTKGNESWSVRKDTDNNPGPGVSVNQLQSYQTVLVPQFSGNLTSACI